VNVAAWDVQAFCASAVGQGKPCRPALHCCCTCHIVGQGKPCQHSHSMLMHSAASMCSSLPLCIGPRAADGDGSQTGGQAARCARVRLGRGARGVRARDAAASLFSLISLHSLSSPCCTGLNGVVELAYTLILSCGLNNVWSIQSQTLDFSLGPSVHVSCRHLAGSASARSV